MSGKRIFTWCGESGFEDSVDAVLHGYFNVQQAALALRLVVDLSDSLFRERRSGTGGEP